MGDTVVWDQGSIVSMLILTVLFCVGWFIAGWFNKGEK